MNQCITPSQRMMVILSMLAPTRSHGVVSQLSRDYQISRQTLYRWKQQAEQTLQEQFASKADPHLPCLQRDVLTLLIESHASYRQIQTCLNTLLGRSLSLGSICRMVEQAGARAQAWLKEQCSSSPRSLALDEQFSSQRGSAYLNIVDVHSGQVWATLPPTTVDAESWMLALWDLQAQGVEYETVVSDGGLAIHDALKQEKQLHLHQRDVWHVLDQAGKIQRRVEALVEHEEARLRTISIYEQRKAQGHRFAGRPPKHERAHQQRCVDALLFLWEAVAYLFGELHRLLAVVIRDDRSALGVMSVEDRKQEIQTVIELLSSVAEQAPKPLQHDLAGLARLLQLGHSSLLHFSQPLEHMHQQAAQEIGAKAVQVIAWAWNHRAILGPEIQTVIQGMAPEWRACAQKLFDRWTRAVRASSVVENWHSLVRPHLAVHRSLSANVLALLAVWHNHRIAPRGLHVQQSPLQRSQPGLHHPDWLTALGYPAAIA